MTVGAGAGPARLRQAAEEHAARFPPLLAEAQRLAMSITPGTHGRRREGTGEEFWQFRPAMPGDEWRSIDWRRSARGDAHFIRQHEWQAAQSVLIWVDGGRSMAFSGDPGRRAAKIDHARVLAMALAILLLRGGERVGLLDDPSPPRAGRAQVERLIAGLIGPDPEDDHTEPTQRLFPRGARAVMFSDFLGDMDAISRTLKQAARQGVHGALVQLLDPVEEAFPFDGRTTFHSMSGKIRFETLRARGLKDSYLQKLAARKAFLATQARQAGWQYLCHHGDDSPLSALMWLYTILQRGH